MSDCHFFPLHFLLKARRIAVLEEKLNLLQKAKGNHCVLNKQELKLQQDRNKINNVK